MLTDPIYEGYLIQNNVSFFKKNTTLDPAQTIERGYVTEMLVIPPQNISLDFRNLFCNQQFFGHYVCFFSGSPKNGI